MNPKYWKLLEKVKHYLASKRNVGIEGMKRLLPKITSNDVELVVITFTYERLEVYVKKNNQFELNHDLSDSLNRYEIEDIIDIDYNCDDNFESFQFTQVITMTSELIKYWIADCYQTALNDDISTKVYFKEQHDQMEIFELNSYQTFYEKTAFETFVKNNQSRQILLLA